MEMFPSNFGVQLSAVGTQPRPKPTANKATRGQVSFCKPAARGLPKLTTDVKQLVLDLGADFGGEIYMSQRTGDTPLCITCIGVCPVGQRKSAGGV